MKFMEKSWRSHFLEQLPFSFLPLSMPIFLTHLFWQFWNFHLPSFRKGEGGMNYQQTAEQLIKHIIASVYSIFFFILRLPPLCKLLILSQLPINIKYNRTNTIESFFNSFWTKSYRKTLSTLSQWKKMEKKKRRLIHLEDFMKNKTKKNKQKHTHQSH